VKYKNEWIIGVDEAGEEAWDASASTPGQPLFSFQKNSPSVCQLFRSMRNSDNLNSSCKEDGL